MSRASSSAFIALALAACGSDVSHLGPPTGADGRKIRNPCHAGVLVLRLDAKLSCDFGLPVSPQDGDPRYFGSAPCSRTSQPKDGPPGQTENFEDPAPLAGRTYNDDGNLSSWNAKDFVGDDFVINYRYDGELLVGAQVVGMDKVYVYEHEDDRRVLERVENAEGRYHYVYDEGQLIASGPPVNGDPPQRYEESFLARDAQGRYPMVPPLDVLEDGIYGATAPHYTYFYDGDHVRTVGRAGPPGRSFSKYTYRYDGDVLQSVELDTSDDSNEPSQVAQTWTYSYSCP